MQDHIPPDADLAATKVSGAGGFGGISRYSEVFDDA